MKLLVSTKGKITKDKNAKNVSHLEIIEVVTIKALSATVISEVQESCIHLFPIDHFVNYQISTPKFCILKSF